MIRKKSVFVALGLLVAALALVAAGCGGSDSTEVTALPSSSCTGIEYEGEGDPDVLIASDLPMQGPSRVVTEQMVAAIRQVLDNNEWKAGDYNVAYQACDDATAQAANYDTGKCSQNGNAYAANDSLVAVLGTYNSPCAEQIIPLLNKAKGGEDGTPNPEAIPLFSAANTWPCLTVNLPGACPGGTDKYYPTTTRNYLRVAPSDDYQGAFVAEFAKEQGVTKAYILNDKESYGAGVAGTTRKAMESVGIEIVGDEAWNPKASSYEALMNKIKGTRRRRGLPRRTDLRERRPGDQGQGRGARTERRRREAVRTRRLREPGDHRSSPGARRPAASSPTQVLRSTRSPGRRRRSSKLS